MFEIIPSERREAARSAVAAAFGATPESISPISGGASALTYRLDLAGRPYVLRLEAPDGGLRAAHRSFQCMRMAAEAGLRTLQTTLALG